MILITLYCLIAQMLNIFYTEVQPKSIRRLYRCNEDNNKKAIFLNDTFAEAYNNRGLCKYYTTDDIGALEDFTKTIALKEDFIDAYNNRGNCKFYGGNDDETSSRLAESRYFR